MDYVHFNPVKHGLVASPADWPYSTFRSCAERGLYPLDWIGDGIGDIEAGEPGG
jgi:putative transposase